MNAREAFSIVHPEEALRIRRRELESEAEAERMAIKLFQTHANEWLVKVNRARLKLQAINDELDQIGELQP